jgi:hypothetical protein
METPNLLQLPTPILEALNNLISLWTQDPLASNHSLIITENLVSVHDGTDIVLSLQLPIETEPLFATQNIEETVPQEPAPSLRITEPENINIVLKENSTLEKLFDDLTEEKEKVITQRNPLTGLTYEAKFKEILSRLKEESRGKCRDHSIRILEASYYLEQIRKDIDNDKSKIQKMKETLKNALGSRRARKVLKCADRIYQLLQVCGLLSLYSTTAITLSNLEEISEEDFMTLLHQVRIRRAHF